MDEQTTPTPIDATDTEGHGAKVKLGAVETAPGPEGAGRVKLGVDQPADNADTEGHVAKVKLG